jgi:hypothetical protein
LKVFCSEACRGAGFFIALMRTTGYGWQKDIGKFAATNIAIAKYPTIRLPK